MLIKTAEYVRIIIVAATEYQECNKCCIDKCEIKGLLQIKFCYPQNAAKVYGIFDIDDIVKWVGLGPCKCGGRWAVAVPQVATVEQHGTVQLQAQPMVGSPM